MESGFSFADARVFKESKGPQQTEHEYERYKQHVRAHGTGIMMCVSRGKLSEGLNFSDSLARACFVVGIPFLLVNDPKVNLKKQYLDSMSEMGAKEIDYVTNQGQSQAY